jgi:uncharacterized membrane protein YphA (DoxX/SURF4 family)
MSRSGQTSSVKQAFHDLAALVGRFGVGGIFFANGWHKLEEGLRDTGASFAAQGAPAPRAWATTTMLVELIGGTLLIAGLVVSIVGLLLFAEALAVFLVAPPLNPITLNELVLLGVAALLLAVVGAGRLSVDHMVVIRRRESAAASEFAADTEADRVIASLRDPDAPAWRASSEEPAASPRRDQGDSGQSRAPDMPAGATTAEQPSTRAAKAAPRSATGQAGPPESSAPGSDDEPADGGRQTARGGQKGAGTRTRSGRASGGTDDTAPHPVAGTDEPPSQGDVLVAGPKKQAPRGRRTQPDE